MNEYLIPSIIIFILIVLNGIFVAAEFAIVAVPISRVSQKAKKGSKISKAILAILKNSELQNGFITTAQLGITIVSLGLGMYGEHKLTEWILHWIGETHLISEDTVHVISAIVAIGFMTYLHVVFGEMIPKSLALQTPQKTVYALYNPMKFLGKVFQPAVLFLNGIASKIISILPIGNFDESQRHYSGDEIEFILEESTEVGLVKESDLLIFENIFDLNERMVNQAMTPRNKVIGININSSSEEIIDKICSTNKTRFPIFDNNMDNIIGILHIKDLAKNLGASGNPQVSLKEIMRPCLFVPETLSIPDLMNQFRQENNHIAIVFGEHGGTSGLITLEDLLEEVVGEIQDEFDEDTTPIIPLKDGKYKIKGNVILDEINQYFDWDWEYSGITTIGGLVMAELGRIPNPNDEILFEGVQIVIHTIKGMGIESVIITIPNSPGKPNP